MLLCYFILDEETEKESMMEHIGDLFEYGNISNNEVIEGVNLLLTHVVLKRMVILKRVFFTPLIML